jgi:hypothetical protein
MNVYIVTNPHISLKVFSSLKKAKDNCKKYYPFATKWRKTTDGVWQAEGSATTIDRVRVDDEPPTSKKLTIPHHPPQPQTKPQ